jgi:glycerate dehydrogenase
MATKAVFLDFSTMGPGLDLTPLTELAPDLELFDTTTDGQVGERIRDAEIVFVNKVRLTPDLLESAAQLRFIGIAATGSDNVDLANARQNGIAVCNIRGYCTRSVTEHVFGVLLMLTHNLHRYASLVRAGRWQKAPGFCMHDYPVRELSTMTIGIVGHGVLGRSIAEMARNFDMDVLIAARPGSTETGENRVGLSELLERADVVSLHCPLTEDTQNLLGRNAFAMMKRTAILINTARGSLVDSAALVDALRQGQIAAAAIDVLPAEPPAGGDPLLDYAGENLVVTPHIAWSADCARQNCVDELAANLKSFLEGGTRNRVA